MVAHAEDRQTRPDIALLLFLLLNATLILRPAELVPALAEVPIYEFLILGACVFAHRRILRQFSLRAMTWQPVSLCVVGLPFSAVMSHLAHLYLSAALDAGVLFFKTLIYYALFLAVISSVQRLRLFFLAVALASSGLVALCVADYLGWLDLPFVNHIVEWDGVTWTNEARRVVRMRGAGIFSDPNDISLLIVAAGVLCSYFLADRRRGTLRFLWLGPIVVLLCGLYCTRSRGGLLAAGAAGMTLLYFRCGWKPAIALAVVGLAMLPVMGGRQASIDLESGTGHERILLWRDGFVAIQSPDVLFGIGLGMYEDVAGLVAHNSFIHAYVELGLVGGTLFFGCFFFSGLALLRMRRLISRVTDPDLRSMYPFVAAVLVGWCMGMMSLSRCYVVPTYMVAAIGAVYVNLVRAHVKPVSLLVRWDLTNVIRLATSSAALFLSLFILTIAIAN